MVIVLFIMLFTGCSEYGEKRLVKLVTVDKENISVFYYDYSAEAVVDMLSNYLNPKVTEFLKEA